MPKISAILVDDEESARNILSKLLIQFCPNVELLGQYANVEEAVKGIEKHQPDVVFLDIEMPRYAGYEIVDFFENVDFQIVFVTAYDHYAIKAFEVAAVDYLLKPIKIDRLKEAVARLEDRLGKAANIDQINLLSTTLRTGEITRLSIMYKGNSHLIAVEEIVAIRAEESYSIFIMQDGSKLMASRNLKHFEKTLENNPAFLRAHKSWIVNAEFIDSYSKSRLEINLSNGLVAKLSKHKKSEFVDWLEKV